MGRRSARLEERAFVIEGPMAISEALATGWRIEAEFCAPECDPVSTGAWFRLAPGVLERVASTQSPQGHLAVVEMPPASAAIEALAGCQFLVVADRLSDPGNLGTLIRSAEAAGADAVALTVGTVDPFNPKVVRSTAGALFHLPIIEAELAEIQRAGLRVIGSSSHHGIPHTDFDWGGRIAVVVGNEAQGITEETAIDEWVRIEHHGRSESLNVAMAATLLCFEAARQRSQ